MSHSLPRFLLAVSILFLLAASTWAQQAPADQKSSLTPDDAWRNQFKAAPKPIGDVPGTQTGHITYILHRPQNPTPEEEEILKDIAANMDKAIKIYNTYTKLKKTLNIFYDAGVPTADGNINGSIRFGKTAHNLRVCLHEMGHTMGVGQHQNWQKLMVNHVWQGKRATKLLQELTNDPKAELHGDNMHFWPYGLNYDSEVKSDEDFIRHAKIVDAIAQDLEDVK